MISATLYNDPGCPWGYSASPALRVLEWRYAGALDWRLVLIGLTERAEQYEERGYTPAAMAAGHAMFRDRYGMPFSLEVKARVSGTARACRAIVAARIQRPGSEWAAMRALQLSHFNTSRLLDDDEAIADALAGVAGLDARELVAALDSPEVSEAYERDRAESRTAAGSPTEFQGKAAASDGPVRFTAPSLQLRLGERTFEAGGFQPVEAYDVLVANLDPEIPRREPPDGPAPLLEHFREGLSTQEVAALLARGNTPPDRAAAELQLLELVAGGSARRQRLGSDALWFPAETA